MSKYGSVLYNQSVYGQKSRLAFSVEPFSAVALDYTTVALSWSAPVGAYTAFRVVRNQDGFSETVEDGVTIYEEFGIEPTTGSVSISTLIDGDGNTSLPALVGGKFSYYQVWILKASDKVWYPAGNAYTLIPSQHPTYGPAKITLQTTHDKVMNLLPRVYTSTSHSPVDEVTSDSDLYRFMQGFSFTIDELLSMADSLLPDYSGSKTSPSIISSQADQLGLTREPTVSIKHQKRMIREALYMYSRKGTALSASTLVESLTGYDSTLSVSDNLMLSTSDSSFTKSLGFWIPVGNCQITLDDVTPVTSESLTIDKVYSGKVVVGTAGAKVVNGEDYPVTRGIPVTSGVEYKLSFYSIVASSTGGVTPSISWYDYTGTLISTSTGTSVTATTTWDSNDFTATAPAESTYASIAFAFGAVNTYNLDMVQFAVSTATSFSEARALTVFLQPSKYNYLSNPSFEAANAAWTIVDGTATEVTSDVSNYVLVGDTVLEVDPGSTEITSAIAAGVVATNSYLTFSTYARTLAATDSITVSVNVTTELTVANPELTNNVASIFASFGHPIQVGDVINISGLGSPFDGIHTITEVLNSRISYALTHADIPSNVVTGIAALTISNSAEFTATTAWSRGQVTIFVPGSFIEADTSATVSVSGTFTNTVQLDAAQLEPKYQATDYFDGSYGTERDALWSGTTNNSPSYLYPNKIINVSRLVDELPKFLPYDTSWIISSYSGTEASGIS
jgi:hypothetical protein